MSKTGNHYQDVQQSAEYREGWEAAALGLPMQTGEYQRIGYNDAQNFRAEGGEPLDALDAIGAA